MLDEIKNVIKSMLILFAFMLMTGFLLLQMHAMNEINNQPTEDKSKEQNKLSYDINGVDYALSNYYKVDSFI